MSARSRSPHLTKQEAKKFLGYKTVRTLEKLVADEQIPFRRFPGARGPRFPLAELELWVDGHRVLERVPSGVRVRRRGKTT